MIKNDTKNYAFLRFSLIVQIKLNLFQQTVVSSDVKPQWGET